MQNVPEQDTLLRKGAQNNVVALDGIELMKSVVSVLSLRSKQQVRDIFKELHFLEVGDRLLCELRENNNDCEMLFGKKKLAEKIVRETTREIAVKI